MNIVDIIYIILTKLDVPNIVKCSSISKIFNNTCNNDQLWAIKLNEYYPFPKNIDHKETYKKYYRIHTLNKLLSMHAFWTVGTYIPKIQRLPKLPFDTKYVTKNHKLVNNQCTISNINYIGIRRIKILLVVKQKIKELSINLIRKIILKLGRIYSTELNTREIELMQKINGKEKQEISYEKNGLWYHEINLLFGIIKPWLPTMDCGSHILEVHLRNKEIIHDTNVIVSYINLENKQMKEILKTMGFMINTVDILKYTTFIFRDIYYNKVAKIKKNQNFIMIKLLTCASTSGIIFYLMDSKMFNVQKWNFGTLTLIINSEEIKMERKEIIKMDQNMYYISLVLNSWKKYQFMMMEPNLKNKKILLKIENIELEEKQVRGVIVVKILKCSYCEFRMPEKLLYNNIPI